MNKKYKTSVRRAANELVTLGATQEYTASFEEHKSNHRDTVEVIQWLVDRDVRKTQQIQRLTALNKALQATGGTDDSV